MGEHISFGVFAHVDAGKTTLSEQILHLAGAVKEPGRVDHRDAFMDNHPLEQQRGITIFSEQTDFSFGKGSYTLIDTPGHVDFSAEMERAVAALDYAILVVSAVEGVQAHTYTVYRILREAKKPVFVFINKLDRTGADLARTQAELRQGLDMPLLPLDGVDLQALPQGILEELAQTDEGLLEAYLAGNRDMPFWKTALVDAIRAGRLCPAFSGSALHGAGVLAFFAAFDALTTASYDENAPFGALVYKIRHDEHGQRLVYIKAMQGQLSLKDDVRLDDEQTVRISELRRCFGQRQARINQVLAGEHAVLPGLPLVKIGQGLGAYTPAPGGQVSPLLLAGVVFVTPTPPQRAMEVFRQLEEEDPMLRVHWLQESGEIQIAVMGPIQLEVLKEVLMARFGMEVRFTPPRILYKETLASPVVGKGHYEPLRHYAEVHLRMEPGERGAGVRFADEASLDKLSLNLHTLIGIYTTQVEHPGALTGAPVTDVLITLLGGRNHLEHTHAGDFREATYRAIRQGLFKGESLLLEPYYAFTVRAQAALSGRISAELTKLHATLQTPQASGDTITLAGRGPVQTLLTFPEILTTMTKGKGVVSFQFDGYEPCHNQAEVIAQANYDREADRLRPADSVFCAKGAGYLVKWFDADAAMHIDEY